MIAAPRAKMILLQMESVLIPEGRGANKKGRRGWRGESGRRGGGGGGEGMGRRGGGVGGEGTSNWPVSDGWS